MGSPGPAPALAVVGLVRNAQGLRGAVVVETLTDAPDAVFAPGRRVFIGRLEETGDPSATVLTVDSARPFKGGLIVSFQELEDRTAAELLRGLYLSVPFEELEPPGTDEVFLHDLVGMQVRLDTGERVGEVISYYELPQGLTLDVATGRGSVLVPYRPEIIELTDMVERVIVVKEAVGLFDD